MWSLCIGFHRHFIQVYHVFYLLLSCPLLLGPIPLSQIVPFLLSHCVFLHNVCTCVHACMSVYMCACIYIYVCICTCVLYMCVCVSTCMCVYVNLSLPPPLCVCVCVHVYVWLCMCDAGLTYERERGICLSGFTSCHIMISSSAHFPSGDISLFFVAE